MGGISSKKNKFDPTAYNLSRYGLSNEEVAIFHSFFQKAAGRDGKLSQKEFRKLYAAMNPQFDKQTINRTSGLAFKATDINLDGSVSFDEFLFPHVISRSRSGNKALNYPNYIHNIYDRPGNVQNLNSIIGQFDSYGVQIPNNRFLNNVQPIHYNNY